MANSSSDERALVLVNPRARGVRAGGWHEHTLSEIASRYAVQIVAPASAAEVSAAARAAVGEGYAIVVAAGGDGTVNAVAEGLRGATTALGILPLGSANDLARELGIPRHDVRAAARVIATGRPRLTDLGMVGERIFCGVGGMALVARSALAVTRFKQRSEASRRIADGAGGSVYRISATAALFGARRLDDRFHIDYVDGSRGERHLLEMRAAALFVANHRTLGGGLVLPVHSKPNDGALEICVVPRRSRISLMLNFARLSAGLSIPPGVLQIVRATEAIITTSRDDAFVADGELLASGRRFEIRVLPLALRIICLVAVTEAHAPRYSDT
jgi:diacylglycerol kinase (ATP)